MDSCTCNLLWVLEEERKNQKNSKSMSNKQQCEEERIADMYTQYIKIHTVHIRKTQEK